MAVFTGSFLSSALGRHTSVSLILPHDTKPEPSGGYPVLYLLHGFTDDSRSWLYRSNIERYATERGLFVVMPDAETSFYADMVCGSNYFTYITAELPAFLRDVYRTSVNRAKNFVAGVSMGGYGALKCALLKPEQYAGCIALSPVADISWAVASSTSLGSPNIWKGILGETMRLTRDVDLFRILSTGGGYASMCPRIYVACGKNDELFDQNIRLKDALDANRIEHTFEQANAGHEWGFWDVALQRGMDMIIR
ncbi:MAG: esterase family protein [Oscillospiraceae bacterium]|nr:esterase family protein [Oscillospiraceae bacterium]